MGAAPTPLLPVHRHDYGIPGEIRLLLRSARELLEREVLPVEARLDPDAIELPAADLARLQARSKELGMWNPGVPEEYGGAGLDFFAYTLFMEEISKHRQGLYNAGCGAFGYGVIPLLYGGTDEQKERYLLPSVRGELRGCFAITEPSGGSDPARAIATRARKTDGGWVLNGTKQWITRAGTADFVTVFVRTDDRPAGERGEITCFIVDTGTAGYEISERMPVIRPEAPYTLYFHDCFVADSQLLGQRGHGFDLIKQLLTHNRIPYAAQCLGVAERALEMAAGYAKQRVTFGQPLADRQAVQWMLADSATELHAARLVTYHAARLVAQGQAFTVESSMAKLLATESAERIVDRAIQIHGGMGLAKELPLERWYRELRTRRIGEGPSEVHRMVIARHTL